MYLESFWGEGCKVSTVWKTSLKSWSRCKMYMHLFLIPFYNTHNWCCYNNTTVMWTQEQTL